MTTGSVHPWKLALGGLLSLAVAMGIGRFVYTPILPFMTESLHLTKAEAGLIASANFAGYLAGALVPATPWLGGSPRRWLMIGLMGSALTTLLTAAWSSVAMLAAVRFVGGVASAFVLVFASSVILERLHGAGRGRLSSVHFAGVGTGIALSAGLVSAVAGLGHGWAMQWLAAGALALVAVPVIAALVPPDHRTDRRASHSAAFTLSPRLTALIVAYGLFGFGYVITATFLVAIVRGAPEIRHLEPVIWILLGLAAIPSVALWAMVGRRVGIYAAFAIACLVEAIGVAASVLLVSGTGTVLAAVCLGGTFTGITALGLVGARDLSASDPSRVIALMTGAFGLGQIVGPALAGALYDWTGAFTLPSLIAAGALVLAAALSAALDWRKRTATEAVPSRSPQA
jgi:predicted MFS family arabinose efflux permease